MARWMLTLVVWAVSTAVLAPVCFFAVLILAGPHSDLLPGFMGGPMLILGWVTFLGVPIRSARVVWKSLRSPFVQFAAWPIRAYIWNDRHPTELA